MANNNFHFRGRKYFYNFENAWDNNGLTEKDLIEKSYESSFWQRLGIKLFSIFSISKTKKSMTDYTPFEKKLMAHNMLNQLYQKSPENGINYFYIWNFCQKVGLPIVSTEELFREYAQYLGKGQIKLESKSGPL